MTPRQRQCLDFFAGFIAEHHYSPSYEEVGAALGLKSKSGVHRMVEALEAHGRLRRVPHRERCIELVGDDHQLATAEAIVAAVVAVHCCIEDEDGQLIACSPAELLKVLRGLGL